LFVSFWLSSLHGFSFFRVFLLPFPLFSRANNTYAVFLLIICSPAYLQ
jgi:hypothetical protein